MFIPNGFGVSFAGGQMQRCTSPEVPAVWTDAGIEQLLQHVGVVQVGGSTQFVTVYGHKKNNIKTRSAIGAVAGERQQCRRQRGCTAPVNRNSDSGRQRIDLTRDGPTPLLVWVAPSFFSILSNISVYSCMGVKH